MSSRDLELLHSAGTYQKRNISIVSGKGVWVSDEEGRAYLDCIAGIGTAILGHADPQLINAITEQAGQIISVPELLCNPTRARYQEKLLRFFPTTFSRVFLCNSGTEAVEAALKFARLATGRHGIIALKRGFHGKTLGALSVTAEEKYRAPFLPLLPSVHHVSPQRASEIEEIFARAERNETPAIGCFIFESIQGESGVFPLDTQFLQTAIAIARDHGALIVADEIQTGFGRTGKMWGFSHAGIEPDIVCIAKGMGGGVPMGGAVLSQQVKELPIRSHTSTFGGNPLACSAALCVLEALENRDLIANAHHIGELIVRELSRHNIPIIRDIRGRGLMIGIELKEHAAPYVDACSKNGLLCLLAGPRVIRLLPPLIISAEEAIEVCDILVRVLTANYIPSASII